jgi:membrane-associated phospholipid phosphatase
MLRGVEAWCPPANSAAREGVLRNGVVPRMNRSLPWPLLVREPGDETGWPTRRRDIALTALAATGVHVLLYALANHYPFGDVRQLELTTVDRAVPFWPWTVFFYLSDYALLFVAFQGCRTRASADRFVVTELVMIGFATLVHWSFPVAFPRELYPLPDELAAAPAEAMRLLRAFDAQTSCLPSLHVAGAVLAPLLIRREQPRAFPWLMAWAGLICLSTLTTKQHYLFDVVAGIALASSAYLVANRFRPFTRP